MSTLSRLTSELCIDAHLNLLNPVDLLASRLHEKCADILNECMFSGLGYKRDSKADCTSGWDYDLENLGGVGR